MKAVNVVRLNSEIPQSAAVAVERLFRTALRRQDEMIELPDLQQFQKLTLLKLSKRAIQFSTI